MRHIVTTLLSLLITLSTFAQDGDIARKAAKLLILGVDGTSLSQYNPIIDDIEGGVSGIILFEKNLAKPESDPDPRATLTKFIADLKSKSDSKLWVAIDQEGGYVNRLKSKYGFETMPSQESVGAANDDQVAREAAALIGREVASVGIDINFAPSVDVNVNPSSPAIGHNHRSFSADEKHVSELASIYIDEYHKAGLLTAIKHFPGHGSSLADSHLGLTDVTNTWSDKELTPFRDQISSGRCDFVMTSHIFNQKLDDKYPATLSKKIITGILRGELGWDGVVISDDMQMKAIVDHYGFEEAIVLGINAGVDLFIIGGNIKVEEFSVRERFVKAVTDGIKNGELTEAQLDQAIARITKLKNK